MSFALVLVSKFQLLHFVMTLLSVIDRKHDTIDGDRLGGSNWLNGQLRSVLNHETMPALSFLSELCARFVEVYII